MILNTTELAGKNVCLRFLVEDDLKRVLAWLKDPEVNMYLSQDFKDLTIKKELDWLEYIRQSPRDAVFAIILKEKDLHIGNCGVHKIDYCASCAEMGIFIGEKKHWDKGYGSEAVDLVKHYVFDVLNLLKIYLNVYEYNHRAIKVYKNCGFRIKKILRKEHLFAGKYWDTYNMEITKEAFRV